MNENNFMKVEDVAKELGISISHSYKIMQQLNKELKAKRVYDHRRKGQPQILYGKVLLRRNGKEVI